MNYNLSGRGIAFPQQRVSASTKEKAEWYAQCIDYVIQTGISCNDRTDTEQKLNILHGNIPNEFYKKTLNPYNSNKEKYLRFPATIRNLDIINDVVRRYISEYIKGVHEFVVGANNPEIVFNKNEKLKEQVGILCMQAFQEEFQKNYNKMIQEAQQNGQNPQEIDPQQAMPDIESFVKDFNDKYIDDQSKQGQDVLDYVRAITEDMFIYNSAFFNYTTFGECYTYTSVEGSKLVKECVPLLEAYPIPNNKYMVEDHDMFARKLLLTYQQILDMFGDKLSKKDKSYLEEYYGKISATGSPVMLDYTTYFERYSDVCQKFTDEERNLFRQKPVSLYAVNGNLHEVWHVVWRGETKQGILTYINELGLQTTRIVEEGYKLNPEFGDIDIEWVYKPQVYEGYRIGGRYDAIYPIKARAIPYNRNGKLPYNGILEPLPYMGKFSIVDIMSPYQILRNIISYHQEMTIAKNKNNILIMPESLIHSNSEDRVYRMAADGLFLYDDSEDTNSIKAQQIRLLAASNTNYITELSNLKEILKLEARELVDMNAQRYGDIAQSAGVGTTQEAIARSSMGFVVLVVSFDDFRRHDYDRDLDYCKFAYIEGLNVSYNNDITGSKKYISLDVNSFVNSDYSTTVRNDAKEIEKIQQLRELAFSAAQNGNMDMAVAAIKGNNVSQISDYINKFVELQRQHETELQQIEQMTKQEEIQAKLQEIQAKGEQDRLTQQEKYRYEMDLQNGKLANDNFLATLSTGEGNQVNDKAAERDMKYNIEQQKMALSREQLAQNAYNEAANRQLKREDIASKERIAKMNKNRYDK